MTGRVDGKVAFVTGAGRGQGRSHAVRLAEEGADIIAVDNLQDYPTLGYTMATQADLDETVKAIETLDRRVIARRVDVRDRDRLASVLAEGVADLGRLDIVCANAAICSAQTWDAVTPELWQDTLDVDLTGVWNTIAAALPHLIAGGGGSIIATSSGLKGQPFLTPYAAAKHGVVGLCRSLANELGRHNIRVNTVHPAGVDTPMAADTLGGLEPLLNKEPGDLGGIFVNTLPVEILQPRDVSNAVLYLASDESRQVTGLQLNVDAGNAIR